MRLRGLTLFLVCGGCLLGVEFLAWSAEGTWWLSWMREGRWRGHVAIEENESKETRVGSVSRGKDDMLVLK